MGVGSDPLRTTEAEWQLAFDVNVHAHRWAAKYLLPGWLASQTLSLAFTTYQAGNLMLYGTLTEEAERVDAEIVRLEAKP